MDPQFAKIFNGLLALVLSLSVHECAHAWAAKLQGDDTAEAEGRLTINPIPHIDVIGTLILPLVMMISGGALFGWAKPVPVDTRNLKNARWGHVVVAAAGPFANLGLAFLFMVILAVYTAYRPNIAENDLVMAIAAPMIRINAILAVFNLLPIAPLDGGTVFPAFLPKKLREIYDSYIAPYGMMILLALMISGSLNWVSQLAHGYIVITMKLLTLIG